MKFNGPLILRASAALGAVTWGAGLPAVFLDREGLDAAVRSLGSAGLPGDPYFDYWLRMGGGAFFALGLLHATLVWSPTRYAVLLPWLALANLFEAVNLFVHGWRLGLGALPWGADVAACLTIGVGLAIVACRPGTPPVSTRTPALAHDSH